MVEFHFPHWKFKPGPPINGAGSQQDSKLTTRPVQWKDLNGNKGAIHPIVSMVLRNLWSRDIMEDMCAVLTTNDRLFTDYLQVHEKTGLANCNPMHELHPKL